MTATEKTPTAAALIARIDAALREIARADRRAARAHLSPTLDPAWARMSRARFNLEALRNKLLPEFAE